MSNETITTEIPLSNRSHLPCTISIRENDPEEIHVWLDDYDIMTLTETDNYNNIVEQMALVVRHIRPYINIFATKYGITVTSECFGVKDDKMYIMFIGATK